MNHILDKLSKTEKKEFINKCKESDEFFYENYIRQMPANKNLQPYSESRFENYIAMANKVRASFRSDNYFLIANNKMSYPLSPEDAFKRK